ncbi:MAG: hypothetical protein AMXMBFR64_49150 [Myxococcales bacterium]
MRSLPAALVLLAACAEPLPDDLANFRDKCIRINAAPIPEKADDPHRGDKHVWACNVELAKIPRPGATPFAWPDGALIVKESTRAGQDYPWLIAMARKEGGAWTWDEYTRNFPDQELLRIYADPSVCTGCHEDVAESSDWIFTAFGGN